MGKRCKETRTIPATTTPNATTATKRDRLTPYFLGAVSLLGLIYICFNWTPSSYGFVLDTLDAKGTGPVFGEGQFVRTDEWSIETPLFQACVRNGFHRINETSLYREDLRNFYALPLADWSLIFKPQLWTFFVGPPALAYSVYWALFMCAFLAGYYLLFRQLGTAPPLAAFATAMVFSTGFVQFWWSTYAPLLAGFPWILLILLRPMAPWKKALILTWAGPAFVLSHVYPTLLITLSWTALLAILAFQPALFRSRGDLLAVAAGTFATPGVVYLYYADVIPIMSATVYPGHRTSPSGGTPGLVVLSQFFPSLTFSFKGYEHLTGMNICEIGVVGSFLPLLTACLTRYRDLRANSMLRNKLLILLVAFLSLTIYQLVPLPSWIGSVLFWNSGSTNRWLFASGLLLILTVILIWNNGLISLHPGRLTLFALLGPVVSICLKSAWVNIHGKVSQGGFDRPDETLLCVLIFIAALSAWYIPVTWRVPVVLAAILLMNVYAFDRFNPVQSAKPIFDVPNTHVIDVLKQEAASDPNGILVEGRIFGAVFNGLGFRSVNHVLMSPRLDFFRHYFPNMDSGEFNRIFNRFATIDLSLQPMPSVLNELAIEVPREVFVPVRNVRQLVTGTADRLACSQPTAGGIEKVSTEGSTLVVEGWAPWMAETNGQMIRVFSARPLRPVSISTVTRPDIAEQMRDYRFVKAGFKLNVSAVDTRPVQTNDVVIMASSTVAPRLADRDVRLPCCGCP